MVLTLVFHVGGQGSNLGVKVLLGSKCVSLTIALSCPYFCKPQICDKTSFLFNLRIKVFDNLDLFFITKTKAG